MHPWPALYELGSYSYVLHHSQTLPCKVDRTISEPCDFFLQRTMYFVPSSPTEALLCDFLVFSNDLLEIPNNLLTNSSNYTYSQEYEIIQKFFS